MNIAALVLVFDTQVWDGNLAIHYFQIELVGNGDSFIPRVFVRPHPGKGLVEVFLQLEVEDDAANLAARALDFP